MPQWDYMCKGFIREMLVREKAGRETEGRGCQAAHLSLGEGRRQRLAGVSEASVRYEHSHQRRPAPPGCLSVLSRNGQSGPCSSGICLMYCSW